MEPSQEAQTPEGGAPPEGTANEPTVESLEELQSQLETANKRYEDLRSNHDKYSGLGSYEDLQQSLQIQQALRSEDEEERLAALEALGYDVPKQEQEYVDPTSELGKRLEQMEQYLFEQGQEQEFNQAQEADFSDFEDQLIGLEGKEGHEFSDDEVKALFALSVNNRSQDGRHDVDNAHKLLYGIAESNIDRIRKAKRAEKAAQGQQGIEEVDVSDRKARQKAILSRKQALDAAG